MLSDPTNHSVMNLPRPSLALLLGALLLMLFTVPTSAQESCELTQDDNYGYSATIASVTENPDDQTYSIELHIANNGCSGCKRLKRLYVEADLFSYSDIDVEVLTGNIPYYYIWNGPIIWPAPFLGFKVKFGPGIGGGNAASFALTYTIHGQLQDQQLIAKLGGTQNAYFDFSAEDFQSVLDCNNEPDDILPFYEPPVTGKSFDIIGPELTFLYETFIENGTYVSDDIFQIIDDNIVDDNVVISVQTQPGQYAAALSLLTSPEYGLSQESADIPNNTFTGIFPIENLLSLNELPDLLVAVRPVYSAILNTGFITSQGDTSLRSYIARDVFNVDGSGIKIGVLSDSYNTIIGNPAGDDIIKGDLPGEANPDYPTPVDVVYEYPFGSRTDEGRAMLQIIHDVAPGAQLAFRSGFLGAADFAQGILDLQAAGCDIIVDDITYISEPFFRDGVVAQAVETVSAAGVSYFSAAGNFGTKSWQDTYSGVAAPEGIEGTAHNFAADEGGTDIYQSISLTEGQYTIVLQWDDGTPGNFTESDFDIYLANEDGSTLFGFNRNNEGGAPLEVLPFTVAAETAETNFLITRASGTSTTNLKYIIFRGEVAINEYDTPDASTITGQANAESTIAVGAVLYSNTPEFGVNPPTIASFSSRGGTPVDGVVRAKPDITAPNGVNTSVDLGGFDIDGDAFPNFFGTSASAPHAAAVGALILEARQKYYEDTLTPELLKGVLQNTAIDMNVPGFDIATGAGYITADSALISLANPEPYLTGISYDPELIPGFDEIALTISGQYLQDSSLVYFNGEPLETEQTMLGDSAIIAIIPPFDEAFPEIQVYNPPLEGTNGLDGGLSNPLYFSTKQTILVSIDSKTKKYGEVIPELTASYSFERLDGSLPLDSADLSAEELERILEIDITTIADNLSNVGIWGIELDPSDPLSPTSDVEATDVLDIEILQRFNITYNIGILTINPLDLEIIPRDTTFTYNDSISGIDFDYIFNNDSVPALITEEDSLAILSAVRLRHGTALVNRPALVRGTALVNEFGEQLLNDTLLSNTAVMISQRLRAIRGTALVNGEAIDPQDFYDSQVIGNAFARLRRGTALVNGYRLVRGTALVNDLDSAGNIVNTIPLTNSESLVNSGGVLNANAINADSNSDVLVLLDEGDIAILSGDSVGNVVIRSINIITGETVGTHIIVPGGLYTSNFNVRYGLGNLTIIPDTASYEIELESLTQVYDGTQKEVSVISDPDTIPFTITYNGSEEPPVDAGTYEVVVSVADTNFVGSLTATLEISPAVAEVIFDEASLSQVYDGEPKEALATSLPEGLEIDYEYVDLQGAPIDVGLYTVIATINDPNYTGSATAELEISNATAQIIFDEESLTQVYDGSPKEVLISSIPEGLDAVIEYNGSTTPPTEVGEYSVVATVSDPNYTATAIATLTISPATAEVLFDEGSLTQVYDGSPKEASASTIPEGLTVVISYPGLEGAPTNAGTYQVEATIDDPNYVGTSTAELTILPAIAEVSFVEESLLHTYDGEAKNADVETVPFGLNVIISYPGIEGSPVDAGTYAVIAEIEDANYIGSISGILTIDQAEAAIIFDEESLEQVYDGSPKTVEASSDPEGLGIAIDYVDLSSAPIDAGEYLVAAFIDDPNYVGSGSAVLTILPGTADISFTEASLNQVFDGSPKEVQVEISPENLSFEITYIDLPGAPTNVGAYAVEATVTDPNYTGFASGTLTISEASASISFVPESLTQVYDGSPLSPEVETSPAGLDFELIFIDQSETPTNAGTYAVEAFITDPNFSGSVTGEFVISQATAEIIFDENSLDQVYDGTSKTVATSTLPEGLTVSLLYDGEPDGPIDAGTYVVEANIEDPNYVGSGSTALLINQAEATIEIDGSSLVQDFDGTPKAVSFETNPTGLNTIVTYNGSTALPILGGSYDVEVSIDDPNYIGSANATLTITGLMATVAIGDTVINQGQQLPNFELTFSGFQNGDDESVIESVEYITIPPYTGAPGIYEVSAVVESANYDFTSGTATLYVNPAGSGVTAVTPVFECFQVLDEPDDNGFYFVAHFSYINGNDSPVYVPRSDKNRLFGANNDNSNLPFVFYPEGGSFAVPFSGSTLVWKLRSNHGNSKRTKYAFTYFNPCDTEAAGIADIDDNNPTSTDLLHDINVFPNPSSGKVFLESDVDYPQNALVEVFDRYGRLCKVSSSRNGAQMFELDFQGFSSGVYFVRVMENEKVEVFNIIIQ